jgi:DNA-binding PadR family transcriptional regulator
MKKPKRLSNPLALAVLVLLFERPMHPYEMATTLKERHKEKSIKLHYGSLYTVIDQLLREGFISAGETLREGKRPEKTVYLLSATGEAEMDSWLRELLSQPEKEFPRFEAALTCLPALLPEVVVALLDIRADRLISIIHGWRASLAEVAQQKVPRLFLIESEYQLALHEAELRYVLELRDSIRNETLEGLDIWRQWHRERAAARQTAGSSAP